MKSLTLILLTLLIFSACSKDDKPDVRGAKWGMTKEQIKQIEKAELVKEGEDILTYRIGGKAVPMEIQSVEVEEGETEEGEVITPPEVESITHEYDLLYVFGESGLGLVVIHLRPTLDEPSHYLELFKEQTNVTTKKVGEPAKGVAFYENDQVKTNPYEDLEAICRGEHALQHVWPSKDKRTRITLELDQKKFAPEPACSIAIFYESVEIPVDQELSDQLHDVL